MTLKLTSSREQQQQSAIKVLEEALDLVKKGQLNWVVLVGEGDKEIRSLWSGYANCNQIVGALEYAKFRILTQWDEQDENM